MEDQIEGVETAVQAQRELDEILNPRGPSGLTRSEVEAKFRALEAGGTVAPGTPEAPSEVDQELAALKKRVRVKT
jgi:phage shock protein A